MRNVGIVLIRGVDGFPGIFRGIALYARAIARAVVATWNNPPDDRLR
jgi:hypothetical protein